VPVHDMTLGVAALCFVLLLIWGATRLARATGLARPALGSGRLRLVQTLALDPRRRVVLLDCDGRELLLLTGGPNDVSLGWLPAREPACEPGGAS